MKPEGGCFVFGGRHWLPPNQALADDRQADLSVEVGDYRSEAAKFAHGLQEGALLRCGPASWALQFQRDKAASREQTEDVGSPWRAAEGEESALA